MHGNTTAEVFITRQWLPDSPKNSCSLWHLEDIGRQTAVPIKIIRYWLLVNAARLAGSWSHRMHSATVARLHGHRGYRRSHSKYQFASDRLKKDPDYAAAFEIAQMRGLDVLEAEVPGCGRIPWRPAYVLSPSQSRYPKSHGRCSRHSEKRTSFHLSILLSLF